MKRSSLACAALVAIILLAAPLAEAKPNVIFILTDDLGYGDVGFSLNQKRKAGEAHIETPTLDRLASEGVILSDHYCAAPVCAPSRASILTGMRQGECSVKNNMFDAPITETETLATVMKGAGYHTYAVGKWGVAGGGQSKAPRTAHPCDKGFDHFYGFLDHLAGHTYFHTDTYRNGVWMGIDEDRTNATKSAEGKYSTTLFTDKAKEYITDCVKDHKGEPFFLYLAYTTVHGPFQIPGEPYEQYRKYPETFARYATCVTILDEQIESLMQHLKSLGVLKNTIIIFTSDNGPAKEYGSDPAFFQSAGPFRGMKRDVLEGGMRVPTFVWRKGGFGRKVDTKPSQSTDWMPTLAEMAGVPAPQNRPGVSLLSRWRKKASPKKAASDISTEYQYNAPQKMVRIGDYTVLSIGSKPLEIYDVRRDAPQKTNLLKEKIDAKTFPWPGTGDEAARRAWMKEHGFSVKN